MFTLRRATTDEVATIMMIVAQGQAVLKSRGVDQWQDGYPTAQIIENDIANSHGFILEYHGETAAYAAIIKGIEPAYTALENGQWINDEPYITLHRLVASDSFRGHGVGDAVFAQLRNVAKGEGIKSLRADTHKDNKAMQQILAKNNFKLCGDVYYRGSHRLAFQAVLCE